MSLCCGSIGHFRQLPPDFNWRNRKRESISSAEGAGRALARDEAPQSGTQSREQRMPAKQALRGAADYTNL
jgi:hypothetical protein